MKKLKRKTKNSVRIAMAEKYYANSLANAFIIITELNGVFINESWENLQEIRELYIESAKYTEGNFVNICSQCENESICEDKTGCNDIDIVKATSEALNKYHSPDMSIERRHTALTLITTAMFWEIHGKSPETESQMIDMFYTDQAAQDALYLLALYQTYSIQAKKDKEKLMVAMITLMSLTNLHNDIISGTYKKEKETNETDATQK